MEMAQLEYFSRVVQEKSFSKAADKVFRTQPAVSIAIRRLEEEIGLPLLDRTQKTPVLTEAGQVVYDYAQRILGLRDCRDAEFEKGTDTCRCQREYVALPIAGADSEISRATS